LGILSRRGGKSNRLFVSTKVKKAIFVMEQREKGEKKEKNHKKKKKERNTSLTGPAKRKRRFYAAMERPSAPPGGSTKKGFRTQKKRDRWVHYAQTEKKGTARLFSRSGSRKLQLKFKRGGGGKEHLWAPVQRGGGKRAPQPPFHVNQEREKNGARALKRERGKSQRKELVKRGKNGEPPDSEEKGGGAEHVFNTTSGRGRKASQLERERGRKKSREGKKYEPSDRAFSSQAKTKTFPLIRKKKKKKSPFQKGKKKET